MKLVQNGKEVTINTNSNWPLIEDLFIKWGHEIAAIKIAKQGDANIVVRDMDAVTSELSAWGIPWKRTEWVN